MNYPVPRTRRQADRTRTRALRSYAGQHSARLRQRLNLSSNAIRVQRGTPGVLEEAIRTSTAPVRVESAHQLYCAEEQFGSFQNASVDIAEQEHATDGRLPNLAKDRINSFRAQVVRDAFPDEACRTRPVKAGLKENLGSRLPVEVDADVSDLLRQKYDRLFQRRLFSKQCLRAVKLECGCSVSGSQAIGTSIEARPKQNELRACLQS